MQVLIQIAAALLGFVLFAAAFVFASLILATAAAGALMLSAWIMWRTRHARRAASHSAGRNRRIVIEGEYVVDEDVNEPRDNSKGSRD